MAQTRKDQDTTAQRQNRPGQRQQERLMRQQRRRRRQRIWTSTLVAIVVIAVAGLVFWQIQRLIAQQNAATAAAQATATVHSEAHATAIAKATATALSETHATATASFVGPSCSVASASPTIYHTKLKKGPTSPPTITDTPAINSNGLQCIDLKVGSGVAAKVNSTVSVQYIGWLASTGTKFDSSYDHGGTPFSLSLGQGQVIPGWDAGLVGMKPGGIRRLIIPASLAYGAAGSPPTIPANATLIFDVFMVSVK